MDTNPGIHVSDLPPKREGRATPNYYIIITASLDYHSGTAKEILPTVRAGVCVNVCMCKTADVSMRASCTQ